MAKGHNKIRAVKGMPDILPPMTLLWQEVEEKARRIFSTYGYGEIRTPIVERTELFRRGVGETTSIVEKEMYSFVDQGDEPLTLRPEGTASVVRAYIEGNVFQTDPIARYFYGGPMFRRERPQKGRQRQFHQIGCELLGVDSPLADAEMMAMVAHFFSELGLSDLTLEINSIGCNVCRPNYNEALVAYFREHQKDLCADCMRRLERNALRILDCKQATCRSLIEQAPRISTFWCGECEPHFAAVRAALEQLEIPFSVNERIVRGLDYYMRTAFEFTTTKLGAQNAVAAGGRYDGLVKELGGPDVAGVGFALGMERLILLLEMERANGRAQDLVFFAVLGEKARDAVLPLIQTIRRDGVRVVWDYAGKSLKAQMRRADRLSAETVVIVGDDEITKGIAQVRDMRAGTQAEVRIRDLPLHFVEIGG